MEDRDEVTMLPKRRYLSDEIVVNQFNEYSAQLFRDQVLDAAKDDPMRPIVVYIDSNGGEADALVKMIETMDEVPNPIVTVCMGKAMSAGAILLSHGDIRFCGKHSRIMFHEVSYGTMGDIHDVDSTSKEVKRLNADIMDLFAKNCKIKGGYEALRKMMKDKDGRDHYLNAEEAVKFGIVDVIGTPSIIRASIYRIEIAPPKKPLLLVDKTPSKPSKRSKNKKSDS